MTTTKDPGGMRRAHREKAAVTAAVEADFKRLENVAEKRNPGLLQLLRVYNGYEDSLSQAEKYVEAFTTVRLD